MAKITGLPTYDTVRRGGLQQIRCSAWGVFGLGYTRKEAFDNWKEASKQQSPNDVKQAIAEEAAHGY